MFLKSVSSLKIWHLSKLEPNSNAFDTVWNKNNWPADHSKFVFLLLIKATKTLLGLSILLYSQNSRAPLSFSRKLLGICSPSANFIATCLTHSRRRARRCIMAAIGPQSFLSSVLYFLSHVHTDSWIVDLILNLRPEGKGELRGSVYLFSCT